MSGLAPGVAPVPARRFEKTLRWFSVALIVAVLVAAIVLPLININRYHRTISETVARSIGHPVHLGSVKLQLLPSPGLAITDFVVEENPDFGAEPLLRSPAVTVSLRLSSMWRRRLEVSRIDLDDASVNLVHSAQGQWNFGSLLEQAARIPNAPTAQRHSSGNPRFPYIQFKSARINFKSGNEKTGFAFLNANLSIWLDNPDQWRLRFEAQPARTDLDLELEDMGLMRIEGALNRAVTLDEMPVKLRVEWSHAELGQATRMLLAEDPGWRGDLRAEADLAGDLRDLHLATRLQLANAHRVEFFPLTPFDIDARCTAEYRHPQQIVDNLTCLWPVGDGHLLLTGSVQNFSKPQSRLALEINQTPASLAVNVLGLLRAELPADLQAKGLINGNFTYASVGAPRLSGQATIEPLRVSFDDGAAPFMFPRLHFATPGLPEPAAPRRKRNNGRSTAAQAMPTADAILLDPAMMEMGGANPFQVSGQFTLAGFSLRLSGGAAVGRLKQLSPSFGSLHSAFAHFMSQGMANLDLTFAGPWLAEPMMTANGLAPPTASAIQGWVHLQNAQAKLDWLPEPVLIAAASADFDGGRIRLSNASATINGVAVHGSADAALRCDSETVCPAHFNLDIPALDAATLQSALLGAGRHGELLETILAQVERKSAPWPAMNGQAQVDSFTLGDLALHDVRSAISVEDHRLQITSLDAAALGGSMHATGTVEASGSQPEYVLEANLGGINVAQMAALFKEKWPASGVMSGGAQLVMKGYSSADLASSAQGTFHWLWNSGSLMGIAPSGAKAVNVALSPARFSQWSASGTVGDGALTLNTTGVANPVSGTISFDRKLDLVWRSAAGAEAVHVGGTLAHPAIGVVQAAPNP
jgi:AsmA family